MKNIKKVKGFITGPAGMYPGYVYVMYTPGKKSKTLSLRDEASGMQISINMDEIKDILGGNENE